MVYRSHAAAVNVKPQSVLTGDAKIIPNERCGGNAAETYNYFGVYELYLLCEPRIAGILLLVTGVTVPSTFEHPVIATIFTLPSASSSA